MLDGYERALGPISQLYLATFERRRPSLPLQLWKVSCTGGRAKCPISNAFSAPWGIRLGKGEGGARMGASVQNEQGCFLSL